MGTFAFLLTNKPTQGELISLFCVTFYSAVNRFVTFSMDLLVKCYVFARLQVLKWHLVENVYKVIRDIAGHVVPEVAAFRGPHSAQMA
jgi:hypothetical protein